MASFMNPQIDMSDLIAGLREYNEHFYAAIVEDAVAYLNNGEQQLRHKDVRDLTRAVGELERSSELAERQLGHQLREFVDHHKGT